MKDDSCKTDMLDCEGQFTELNDLSHLTELQSSDNSLDLLHNWQGTDQTDSDDISQLYNRLLVYREERGVLDSATFVPVNQSLLGSILQDVGKSSQSSPVSKLRLPALNDTVFEFRLLHELGTGSFAKVFLARQGELANREVVLKVSAIEGSEPQTLAQLQHTHVVPIYSVHEDTNIGLRAVCMPYFGGASLSKVLERVWEKKSLPQQGVVLVEALDRASGPKPATQVVQHDKSAASNGRDDVLLTSHTARDTLAAMTYVQAAVWTVSRLAEGLQHSHERNIIHRDIKPSNILISAEGQPLLLDFNVSLAIEYNPHDTSLGGTIAYMAPEHLRAAISRDAASIPLVNHRSDIYSLGLVLYEMLTGASPFKKNTSGSMAPQLLDAILAEREQPVPSLKANSKLDIPWSLESILRKCLATSPRDRYASAAQFGEDLNRFLLDQPLKFAPELSVAERVTKWVRRHPRLTISTIATVIAAAFIVPGLMMLVDKEHRIVAADTDRIARAFREKTQAALSMTNIYTPNEDTLKPGLKECRDALARYSVLSDDNWQNGVYWRQLAKKERIGLAESIRELLINLASAQLRQAPNQEPMLHQALALLDKAEQIQDLPPSKVLLEDRSSYLSLLKRHDEARAAQKSANATPANSAHDQYMQAAALARRGTLDKAIILLSSSIKKDPSHYWSYFERALCYQELNQITQAASDLGTCIALWPDSSWAHFNRGHLLSQGGHNREAIDDYTEAIRLSPAFQSAFFNRALAHLELQQYELALNDFNQVVVMGRDDAVIAAARGMAFEGLRRHQAADEQFKIAKQRAKVTSSGVIERVAWTTAFAVANRQPEVADEMFAEILRTNPKHPQALYGRAMIKMGSKDLRAAVIFFDQAIESKPNFTDALRYRAICLARLGELRPAASDISVCMEVEPSNPESFYASACVVAISARHVADKEHRSKMIDQALYLVERAILNDVDKMRALEDPDLSILRDHPDFIHLTGSVVDPQTPKPTDDL